MARIYPTWEEGALRKASRRASKQQIRLKVCAIHYSGSEIHNQTRRISTLQALRAPACVCERPFGRTVGRQCRSRNLEGDRAGRLSGR
ncbi:hypothetical protein SKAU_G00135750 [Synaphobranchus kaupii]|uniref:Uncharacterized protein n=1 Tax=Synaphobranchus kaupii TaxID=118154 RepID=A0A9Q1J2T4_SYNKA|nr:hypothetical protein SKAU_G00135750 [Synaphobranchus kaupii]